MSKCIRCNEEIDEGATLCPKCMENLKYTYNVDDDVSLTAAMCNYIKDNGVEALMNLVAKAVKMSEEDDA